MGRGASKLEGKPAEGEAGRVGRCKVGQRAAGDSNSGAGLKGGAETGQRESAKQRARKPGRGYKGASSGWRASGSTGAEGYQG